MKHLLRATLATLGLFACICSARAQTTQLQQTAPGPNCHTYGCINTPLSDGEVFTWCHTSSCTKTSFRGLNYLMTAHTSGFPIEAVDLTSTAYENNGFAVHTDFLCGRFGCGWHDGYFQLNKKYVGFDPFLYGDNGQVNVTSGNGQVGLVTALPYDLTVTLVSSDPTQIQVPASVVILAGTLDANFTITATAPTQPNSPPYLTESFVTVTATFTDDGTASTATVGVEPLPAPTPPSS